MPTTKKSFGADVAQLIQLVTHSIYSNKDVFLRELISNANDAIQKAKIYAAQDSNYLGEEQELHIIVDYDQNEKTITVKDTGIGMNREQIIDNLGTIAKSGTKAFLDSLKEQKDAQAGALIGQFGIGFYSAFMVAKRVEVESKAVGEVPVLWSSEGAGTYQLKDSKKSDRGTEIRLFLADDAGEYADRDRLVRLLTQHSNYIPVPISMYSIEEEKKTDTLEQINAMKSIWTKQKSDVSKDEYQTFYKSLTFDQSEPLDTIHISIEGMVNFKALLYIPKNPPIFGHIDAEQEYGPSLYVQNVMIMERCKDLLPVWLRFVRGVIETPDLPLNVSREILQSSSTLNKIKKTLVKEVLKSLTYLIKNDRASYTEFFSHYSRYIKEGVHYDFEHKEEIGSVLLYHSWKHNSLCSLDEMIERIDQNDTVGKDTKSTEEKDTENTKSPLYYLMGQSLPQLQASPYLEQFEGSAYDVLLMDDPIDERVMQSMQSYKEHLFVSAMHATLDKSDEDGSKDDKKEENNDQKDFLTYAHGVLPQENIESVILSSKLKDSLSILVRKEGAASAQMERIMQSMGQEVPKAKKTLELNGKHPLVKKMLSLHAENPDGPALKDLVTYAYEQAIFLEGGMVDDINGFLQRVNGLLTDK